MKKTLICLFIFMFALGVASQALVIGSEFGGIGNGTAYLGFPVGVGELDLGLTYTSLNDDATKTTGAMLRYRQDLMQMEKAKVGWGVELDYNKVDGGATTTTIIGLLSGEYALTDAIAIYSDIALLTYQTVEQNGTSRKSYSLVNAPFLAYSGFKIYL